MFLSAKMATEGEIVMEVLREVFLRVRVCVWLVRDLSRACCKRGVHVRAQSQKGARKANKTTDDHSPTVLKDPLAPPPAKKVYS